MNGETIRFVTALEQEAGPHASGATSGRYAIAGRALKKGEVVLHCPALVAILNEECRGRRCSWCFCPPRDANAGKILSRCARCKLDHYCSRTCQEIAWKTDHKVECARRVELEKALMAAGFQGHGAVLDALLAARCLRKSASNASAGTLADLETLDGHPAELEKISQILAGIPGLLPEDSNAGKAFDALSRFRNNNFALVDDLFIAIGAGCFPFGAALNHSCRPNCLLTYEFSSGRIPSQIIRVMEDVEMGAELTHSYVDMALPTWERQAQLVDVYGFDCKCVSCSSGAREVLDASLVAVKDSRGAAACGVACPLPVARACSQRDTDLANAEHLFRTAALEEDAESELRLLEEVCRVREYWLHPRHVEVVAAHASAHTASIAAGDWKRAEVHCRCLVDQYQFVYPAWHPIAGLQMYTLAELRENDGDNREALSWYSRAEAVLRLTHGEGHTMVKDLRSRVTELQGSR